MATFSLVGTISCNETYISYSCEIHGLDVIVFIAIIVLQVYTECITERTF